MLKPDQSPVTGRLSLTESILLLVSLCIAPTLCSYSLGFLLYLNLHSLPHCFMPARFQTNTLELELCLYSH